MKSTTFAFLLLFAAAVPGIGAANQPALAHPVVTAQRNDSEQIERGVTKLDVTRALGSPARMLGQSAWVYPGFNGGQAQPRSDDCSILLVWFTGDSISHLQLVNARAEKILAARIDDLPRRPTSLLAANGRR